MTDPTALFGARATDYDQHRPSYPDELFDTLAWKPFALTSPADVVEIGSGTGIFAEALLARGHRVVAVEPNGPMREAAERRLGGVAGFRSVDGRAEATTLPDASADLVVAAQALHWFSPAEAAAEMRRLARPPRRALFVWNMGYRHASLFMRDYHALATEYAPNTAFNHLPSWFDALVTPYGTCVERREYHHRQPVDLEGLVGRLRSASSAPKPGEPRYKEMCDRLKSLFEDYEGRDDDDYEEKGKVSIAYLTLAYFVHLDPLPVRADATLAPQRTRRAACVDASAAPQLARCDACVGVDASASPQLARRAVCVGASAVPQPPRRAVCVGATASLQPPRRAARRFGRSALALALACAFGSCAPPAVRSPSAGAAARPAVFAFASTEVGASVATLWGRAAGASGQGLRINAVVREEAGGPDVASGSAAVGAENDLTGWLLLGGLRPGARYAYRLWFSDARGPGAAVEGKFRTAPDPGRPEPLRFAWLGDVAGQNVCRDEREGYPLFKQVERAAPDFWIALGDMVYADNACGPTGAFGNRQVQPGPRRARTLDEFFEHWRYNRADPPSQSLYRAAPYYAVWDDHEVANDFGPSSPDPFEPSRRAGDALMPTGLRAFLAYNPVAPAGAGDRPLYRALRWGQRLEIFLLDTRSRRDANAAADDGPDPKTMLGAEQRAWLERSVAASDATWKVVVSSVPISAPTGSSGEAARDGWAGHLGPTGYERELAALLRSFARARVRNLLFLTTDVHYAQILRYAPFDDAPGFAFHEAMVGPAAAGFFPVRELDPTFRPERLFFFAPEGAAAPRDFASARRWFNFGLVEIDGGGALSLRVVNALGEGVGALSLAPR
jgi:alkaline phosphatase D